MSETIPLNEAERDAAAADRLRADGPNALPGGQRRTGAEINHGKERP